MSGTGKYPKLIEGLRDAVAELQLPVSTSAEASIKQDKEISPGRASALLHQQVAAEIHSKLLMTTVTKLSVCVSRCFKAKLR